MSIEYLCKFCGTTFLRSRPDQNSQKHCSIKCRWSSYVRTPADVLACWTWTGSIANSGYGVLNVQGKIKTAHRLALELLGENISGKHVLHSCDNKSCVNPLHLRSGTDSDNVKDTMDRKRHAWFRWSSEEKKAWLSKALDGQKRYRSQKSCV
jgi:hypothetical protein